MGLRAFVLSLFRRPLHRSVEKDGEVGVRLAAEKRPGDRLEAERQSVELQQLLGLRFSQLSLLRKALTHRSYLQGNGDNVEHSNERLEFLGDSVLELVVNEHLYRRYPGKREGDLTKMKSLLVSKGVLARRARAMDLGDFILLSDAEEEAGGRRRASILADTWEAVLGAIYIDRGLDAARQFVEEHLLGGAEAILADRSNTNFKNILQELVQADYKTHPRYRTSSEEGPDHEKVFTVEVIVHGKSLGEGKGSNKKQAEQEAARAALKQLGKLTDFDGGDWMLTDDILDRPVARPEVLTDDLSDRRAR